jgi:trans-2,3-dihydro-3-hydroxyanthranilate isomerase
MLLVPHVVWVGFVWADWLLTVEALVSMRVRFYLVDVFAPVPLTGNPLAVVSDADRLTDTHMRAVAREFNLSETTFVVRPTAREALWRLRSFTPAGVEVGGAGHNAMGAWLWLAESGRLPRGVEQFTQQIGDDLLGVRVHRSGDAQVLVSMDQSPPVFGDTAADLHGLAGALDIEPGDLGDYPAQVVSTGAGHLLVGVRDRNVVDRVRPDARRLVTLLGAVGGEGVYVYSLDPVDPSGGSIAYARFFNPTVGIAEDPATGTAAGPLVAMLVARGVLRDGVQATVEQGYAMGRPSRLEVSVAGPQVRLTGSGVVVGEGTLLIGDSDELSGPSSDAG